MEAPESVYRNVPDSYSLISKTKKVWRYHTATIEDLLGKLLDAEERRDLAVKDGLRKLFSRFDADKETWSAVASALEHLDCLCALAQWSALGDGGVMTRPVFVSAPTSDSLSSKNGGFLELEGARHPSVGLALSSGTGALPATIASSGGTTEFIPNNISLGGKEA